MTPTQLAAEVAETVALAQGRITGIGAKTVMFTGFSSKMRATEYGGGAALERPPPWHPSDWSTPMRPHASIPFPLSADDEARFWSKVDRSGGPDACWNWQGGTNERGYGRFSIGGVHLYAHRVSWVIANGPMPDGLDACHDCPDGDNPSCVNPAHLWSGTDTDNAIDRHAKGRTVSGQQHGAYTMPGRVLRGEAHGRAKITEEQAREIRERYAKGGVLQRELGAEFGISQVQVGYIVRGVSWSHVTDSKGGKR